MCHCVSSVMLRIIYYTTMPEGSTRLSRARWSCFKRRRTRSSCRKPIPNPKFLSLGLFVCSLVFFSVFFHPGKSRSRRWG